ncbi:MAG TPA: hypothetical protein VGE45_01510 [Chloroflexia bacterium]|jgi:hypothetical protein
MANRYQKPDPAIKKNVIRSRQGAKGAKRGQGFVVTASLAATLMGWALFSHQDAQTTVTAQLMAPAPAAITIVQSSR